MKKSPGQIKYVVKNKKASYLYYILDRYEAGISLQGSEVKSIRNSNVGLVDAYCKVEKGQLYILNMNIATYEKSDYTNHEPRRKRRLLMHCREIRRIRGKLQEKGLTLIPMGIYFKRDWAKVELGLAKGKKQADKRESLKQREAKREIRKYRG